MARGRRGGGGGRRPAPARRAPPPSTPARTQASTPMTQQKPAGGGMFSGIGSTIAQGMAFGTGSAIAHRAVGAVAGSVMGGGESEGAPMEQQGSAMDGQQMQQTQQLQGACAGDKEMFFDCLKVNKGDQQACSFLYENLQSCQRSDSQMSFQ
mmetsp:Transcript_18729/g.22351  ORF Transcript_18729/g.22351 Transcript_18729/m.22351 type:complete len:152 (+) Transcript_18729:134-589(+)